MLHRLWIAFRNAVIATALFWVSLFILENSGWEAPAGLAPVLVFFPVFFIGVLLTRRS